MVFRHGSFQVGAQRFFIAALKCLGSAVVLLGRLLDADLARFQELVDSDGVVGEVNERVFISRRDDVVRSVASTLVAAATVAASAACREEEGTGSNGCECRLLNVFHL